MQTREQYKKSHFGLYAEPENLTQLANLLIASINTYFRSRNHENRLIGFCWKILHSEGVSNSHEAPYGKKTNWCGHDKAEPSGYPGFSGRIWVRYATHFNHKVENRDGYYNPASILKKFLANTGTGGSGSYDGSWLNIETAVYRHLNFENSFPTNMARQVYRVTLPSTNFYSWDFRIFDMDWPLLARTVLEQKTYAKLCGDDSNHLNIEGTHFIWNNPEDLASDEKFLDQIGIDSCEN